MWPYGWEHVRADSIKSNTMDPMKVQIEVRAGQQGCPLESKLRSGLQADGLSSRPGESDGPEAWTWEELWWSWSSRGDRRQTPI